MQSNSAPGLLWRLVFTSVKRPRPFECGPWHPDRAHVESMGAWFTSIGHDARVQSNAEGMPVKR